MHFAPAEFVDYARLFPAAPRLQWKAAAVQIAAAPAWTLWRNGSPALLCGLWPLEPGWLEAWLLVPPAARPSPAALRFLLDRARTVFPEAAIVARIEDGHAAGERMALLAGFLPTPAFLEGTRKRTWLRGAWVRGAWFDKLTMREPGGSGEPET